MKKILIGSERLEFTAAEALSMCGIEMIRDCMEEDIVKKVLEDIPDDEVEFINGYLDMAYEDLVID